MTNAGTLQNHSICHHTDLQCPLIAKVSSHFSNIAMVKFQQSHNLDEIFGIFFYFLVSGAQSNKKTLQADFKI